MRLSKLARELSKTPSELVIFFEKRGHKEYTGPNSKISEEHVELLYKKFNPELLEIKNKKDSGPENNNNQKMDDGSSEEIVIETDAILESEPEMINDSPEKDPEPQVNELNEGIKQEDEVEVIRAPKIKLEGVKVVGKIDLPEPVKKVQKEEESIDKKIARKVLFSPSRDKTKPGSHQRKREQDNKDSKNRKNHSQRKPQLSYEEKLRKEEERHRRILEKGKKSIKEGKRKYYAQQIQPIGQQVNVKKSKKVERTESRQRVKPVYKNPVRKFIAWLNCEYDRYE